jgi:2-polyprenyl-3-methyl-5-hydroxy-6-metoxy-1,4-benzoquinol methylase
MTNTFRVVGTINNESNLTELNATDAVNNGFMFHADWMAHIMRYAVVTNLMRRNNVASLLDVGCGRFPLLTYLWRNRVQMQGLKYTGIDLRANETWFEGRTPEYVDVDLVKMNIVTDDPSSVEPAEVVVCTEMLEHINKELAPELLKRLYNWTLPGGVLIFSSPNYGGSKTVASNHLASDGSPREWTYGGKVALLQRAGFTIASAIGTFILLENIPQDFWTPYTNDIRDKLPNSFFRVFAAAAFPQFANNAVFICTKA